MLIKRVKKIPFSWKRVAVIVACGLLIIVLGSIGLKKYTTMVLTKLIHQTVAKSAPHLYHVRFADVSTNFIAGSISLHQIEAKLDTGAFNKLKQEKNEPEYVLNNMHIAQVDIEHVGLLKAIFTRSIDIKSVLIDKPSFSMVRTHIALPVKASLSKTAYQHLAKYCKSLQIDEMRIRSLAIQYRDSSAGSQKDIQIKDMTIDIHGLLVDSLSQYDKTRLWHTKDVVFSIQNYEYEIADKLYKLHCDEISGSIARSDLKFNGLRLTPQYAEMDTAARFKKERERYKLFFEEVVLDKINYPLLFSNRRLVATSLSIKGADIDIFLNRAVPYGGPDKARNFPSLALKRAPLDVQIDTIKWDRSKVSYSEYSLLSDSKGQVVFDQMKGQMQHVTNSSAAIAQNRFCNVTANAMLMGNAALTVKFKFDLADSLAGFAFYGNLGRMNARILNPVLRPFALIRVGKGVVENITFNGEGNTHLVKGKLSAKFSQLRIGILAKDAHKLKHRMLASWYTSILILRSENPSDDDGLFHTSSFVYQRPAYGSFFNEVWKGLAAGLMDNIGLGVQVQQRLKNRALKAKRS